MKRDTFWELVEGADTMAASRQSKTRQMPYTYGRAALSLVCAEHWRDFAALEYSGYICPEYGGEIMIIVPLAEAKNNLSKLVDDAAAGQVITIAKHGRALARLVPMGKSNGQRIGAMKGKLVLPEDFDAPLPDDMLDSFEGTQS
ncbi:MAG: type II toxin-antitoxin system prevent-host-death family antitoxin [Pseudomonas sp.]|jgi:prevent-host-death family protein|uniref:Antitoxin n=2 Tax=Pseudomonas TaxID=286 RepID=A0A9X4HB94_9PSED|nr:MULTISPECIES: type II toxin-antitoxin system prevent-host-death family antitoxin [Pseudomonas]MDD1006752.1 type II toxin-antitoxin system prevent-host-death family antitoxin [Pseudomonas shahriarae]